jgi:D-amino-acid oxidase
MPEASAPSVLVIGAGVIGLTTAVVLAEQGHPTTIWTADAPEETTSMAAGAMWGPYLVEPADKVERWSLRTLAVLKDLAEIDGTGVHVVSGIEASRTADEAPEWAKFLDDYRPAKPDELPDGFTSGVYFSTPAIDMPVYLAYLVSRFETAGGKIQLRSLTSLAPAFDQADVVVNCSGSGARELVDDPSVTVVRGQLVSMENPGLHDFFSEDTGESPDLLHFVPHGRTVVLGGVALDGDWNTQPDPAAAAAIVERCSLVCPPLRNAEVIDHRVGLRPTRPEVRVEVEHAHQGLLLHNYGHGGAGVSLSWGCADEVVELLTHAVANRN